MTPLPESSGSPPGPPSPAGGEGPSLADILRFCRRYAWLILGTAMAAGLMTVGFLRFAQPPQFEAAADVVVAPPGISSELTPRALSVERYQHFLESESVVSETKRRLVEKGTLKPSQALRVGSQLASRVLSFAETKGESAARVIELVGRAGSGAAAADLANTWAEVFAERNRELVRGDIDSTIDFIEQQYSRQQEQVEQLAKARSETVGEYEARRAKLVAQGEHELDVASTRWNRKLAALEEETRGRIAAYQMETRRVLEDAVSAEGLVARKTDGGTDTEPFDKATQAEGEADLAGVLDRVAMLRIQLAQTPEILVLQGALPEGASREPMAPMDVLPLDRARAEAQDLRREVVNPVYKELMLGLSQAEVDLKSLAVTDRGRVRAITEELERLQRERSGGLAKLTAERALTFDERRRAKALELDGLRRDRDREIDRMSRELNLRLDAIDRELEPARELLDQLSEKHNQGQLAKAEEGVANVHITSLAVAADEPRPSRIAAKVLVAIILGGLLGLFVSLLREIGHG